MLLKNCGMLGQKSLLLLGNDVAMTDLFLFLILSLGKLSLALLLVDDEFVLPQALDLSLVF